MNNKRKVTDLNAYPKSVKFKDMDQLVRERTKQRKKKIDEALKKSSLIIENIKKYID
jgi:hypothetical protein